MMRAIAIHHSGGPEVLELVTRPIPRPDVGQILIRVHASGVNRPDIAQRQGYYPPPADASPLPGLEVAGEVVEIGAGVTRFNREKRVMALTHGGGYADYAVADANHALPLPESMDFIQGAGVPETFFTVWSNVFECGGLRAGDVLLVHGGASGIGTTAIQLGRAFGAKIITTVGSEKKRRTCLELGSHLAINYKAQDFVEEVKKFTQGHGADVILDMVGGDYVPRNYQAAALDGRIIQIAFLQHHQASINLKLMMAKRLTHTGSTLRPRDRDFKAQIARKLEEHVLPLLATSQIMPVIDTVLPLEEAIKAHQMMEAGKHIGKIILKVV